MAALSLHREFHGRTWRNGTASEMRSPRRVHWLPRAQLPPGDRGEHGGRAPASSGCTSEHERAVSGRCSSIHRAALMCGVRTGWLPRCQCHVDRRLSCDTGMRHDVSAAGSCSCRSARRQQQHVAAVVLAPPGGYVGMDGRTGTWRCSQPCNPRVQEDVAVNEESKSKIRLRGRPRTTLAPPRPLRQRALRGLCEPQLV